MRILLQAFLSFENGSFKSLWLKFQKAVSLPKILENPQTLCINMKCVIYIETGLCLIFVEIYRLGDIRLGLNSIVEFNSVFFWFDSLVKVSCLPKGDLPRRTSPPCGLLSGRIKRCEGCLRLPWLDCCLGPWLEGPQGSFFLSQVFFFSFPQDVLWLNSYNV